ncbi:MAG: hypothetical protein GY847_19385 [Proteobacteria bacterium]|nr:hypothetical protein [Pseudomonadota bacterium]
MPRFLLFLLGMTLTWIAPALADPDTRIVLLTVSDADSSREVERYFATELKLSLDDLDVSQTEPLSGDFVALSEEKQYEIARQAQDEHSAKAVIWLGINDGAINTLSLFVTIPNGALTRTVAFEDITATAELALTTRALLEQAFAFGSEQINDQTTDSTHPQDSSATASDQDGWKRVPEPEQPPENEPSENKENLGDKPSLRLALEPFARLSTGLAGGIGPSTWIGGGGSFSMIVASNVLFEISFTALAGPMLGPMSSYETNSITGFSLDPELRVGYLWRPRVVLFGPMIGIAAPWSKIEIDEQNYVRHTYSWWTFRSALGFVLRLPVGRLTVVDMGASIGVNTSRGSFVRSEDQEEVFKTPLMVFCARIGLLFFIN